MLSFSEFHFKINGLFILLMHVAIYLRTLNQTTFKFPTVLHLKLVIYSTTPWIKEYVRYKSTNIEIFQKVSESILIYFNRTVSTLLNWWVVLLLL